MTEKTEFEWGKYVGAMELRHQNDIQRLIEYTHQEVENAKAYTPADGTVYVVSHDWIPGEFGEVRAAFSSSGAAKAWIDKVRDSGDMYDQYDVHTLVVDGELDDE